MLSLPLAHSMRNTHNGWQVLERKAASKCTVFISVFSFLLPCVLDCVHDYPCGENFNLKKKKENGKF